jgi:hypothetical protein
MVVVARTIRLPGVAVEHTKTMLVTMAATARTVPAEAADTTSPGATLAPPREVEDLPGVEAGRLHEEEEVTMTMIAVGTRSDLFRPSGPGKRSSLLADFFFCNTVNPLTPPPPRRQLAPSLKDLVIITADSPSMTNEPIS